jgi:hypothetical protein
MIAKTATAANWIATEKPKNELITPAAIDQSFLVWFCIWTDCGIVHRKSELQETGNEVADKPETIDSPTEKPHFHPSSPLSTTK